MIHETQFCVGVRAWDVMAGGFAAEVGERDLVEGGGEALREVLPKEIGAMHGCAVGEFGQARGHFGKRPFDGFDDFANRNFFGHACQRVTAAWAALARNKVRLPQPTEELFEVTQRDALAHAHLAHLHGGFFAVVRKIKHGTNGILGLHRKPHGGKMQATTLSVKHSKWRKGNLLALAVCALASFAAHGREPVEGVAIAPETLLTAAVALAILSIVTSRIAAISPVASAQAHTLLAAAQIAALGIGVTGAVTAWTTGDWQRGVLFAIAGGIFALRTMVLRSRPEANQ